MISASFVSATLKKNIDPALPPPSSVAADDDRARCLLIENDHPGALGDRLLGIGAVRVVALRAAADRNHHVAHPPGADLARDVPDLADEFVIGAHLPIRTVVRAA